MRAPPRPSRASRCSRAARSSPARRHWLSSRPPLRSRSRGAFEPRAGRGERAVAMSHRRSPLRAGASREEVRSALDLPPKRYAALVSRLAADGRIAERGSALALPAHHPTLSAEQEAAWARARAALAAAPLQPPSATALPKDFGIDRDLLAALADRGDVPRVRAGSLFLSASASR